MISNLKAVNEPIARWLDDPIRKWPDFPNGSGLLRLFRGGSRERLQQLFLAVNEGVGIVGGYLEIVAVGDGIAGASFHTIAAENAAVVVDVINLGVALRGADAVVAGVLRGLDVNAIGRAGRRAKEAGNALFQTIFVAAQNMDTTIAILKVHGFGGIILRHRGADHHLEGRGKSLCQRHRRIGYFLDNVWHSPSKRGRNAFGLSRVSLTPDYSITDGMVPVKSSDNPPLGIGGHMKSLAAAQSRATNGLREESKRQGRGMLVRWAQEV